MISGCIAFPFSGGPAASGRRWWCYCRSARLFEKLGHIARGPAGVTAEATEAVPSAAVYPAAVSGGGLLGAVDRENVVEKGEALFLGAVDPLGRLHEDDVFWPALKFYSAGQDPGVFCPPGERDAGIIFDDPEIIPGLVDVVKVSKRLYADKLHVAEPGYPFIREQAGGQKQKIAFCCALRIVIASERLFRKAGAADSIQPAGSHAAEAMRIAPAGRRN